MAKIKFDFTGNLAEANLILATKSGRKLGSIPATDIVFKDSLNSYSEISFRVDKYDNGTKLRLWEQIKDFKLIYCPELDLWFEISLDVNESNDVSKTVNGKTLCEAELSQIMLYNIEINTQTDIERDDYTKPTVFFNEEDPSISLLNRITEKIPHYKISKVDVSIAGIQRTFSFDGKSLYDAFQEVAEEIGCLFVFDSSTTENGLPKREIKVYDLMNSCNDCGYRDENMAVCPKCGGTDIAEGFGKDTGVFISTDNLADNITFTTDTDSVKNCFKVEGGDDLINATLRNCNPNGTDYIWYISDELKEDMSSALVDKINQYDTQYSNYRTSKEISINSEAVAKYNQLVTKYNPIAKPFGINNGDGFSEASSTINGYSALMNLYYDAIDMSLFLQSQMMPSTGTSDTDAGEQSGLLTAENLSPVAVTISDAPLASVESAILGLAKIYVKSNYMVKIKNSAYSSSSKVWTGNFTVTNVSNDKDTADSENISVTVTNDMVTYVNQKVKKALAQSSTDDLSIVGLFSLDDSDFKSNLKKYCLDSLMIFNNACQGCLDILIEQGYASDPSTDVYKEYKKYYDKLSYIQLEVSVRENEISIVEGKRDTDGSLIQYGLKNYLVEVRDSVQDNLNFEKFLGEDLWTEFCAYRREDKYSNSNYISDGLNNAELFLKARELLEVASKEIYKSAELQHSISANLKNLFTMREFDSLRDGFEVGNWIRVKVDDKVYKLRLIGYEIDYSDPDNSPVEFSDVLKISSGVSDIQSVLQQASSIATSYDSVMRQASQGADGSKIIKGWVSDGLALTNSYISNSKNQELKLDSNGFLMREWLPITETYSDMQLKIINKGLYITDDNWETAKAGIGNFKYYLPNKNGVLEQHDGHGVIADTLVGSFILGENVGVYSSKNNITMNEDGITVTNGVNTVFISPSASESVFSILDKNKNKKFYISNGGSITMDGTVTFKQSETATEINEDGLQFYNDPSGAKLSATLGTLDLAVTDENGDEQIYRTFGMVSDYDKTLDNELVYFGRVDGSGIEGRDGLINPYLVVASSYQKGESDKNGDTTWHWAQGLNLMPGADWGSIKQNGIICMWGDVYVGTNKIHSYCDSRLKTNIVDSDVCSTDIINDIEIKSFDWIASKEHVSAGLIAQQLELVTPEVVSTSDATGGIKAVNYNGLIPYLIKGFQEIDKRLRVCERQNNANSSSIAKAKGDSFSVKTTIRKAEDDTRNRWLDNMTQEEKMPYVNMTIIPKFKVPKKGDE